MFGIYKKMELSIAGMSSVGSALVMAGYQGYKCWKKTQRKLNECRKVLLLMPKKAGKSRLVSLLNNNNDNVLVFDVDELIKTMSNKEDYEKYQDSIKRNDLGLTDILYTKLCSEVINYVKKNNKDNKKKMLFIGGRLETTKLLKNVVVAMPSSNLYKGIYAGLSIEDRELAEKERVKFIQAFNQREVFVYNSFEELNSKVSNAFDLKYSL